MQIVQSGLQIVTVYAIKHASYCQDVKISNLKLVRAVCFLTVL